MGGMIAQEVAAKWGNRIISLALIVTTSSFTSTLRGMPYDLGAVGISLTARFRSPRQRVRDIINLLYTKPYLREPSKEVQGETNESVITKRLIGIFSRVGFVDPFISRQQMTAIMTHSVSKQRLDMIRKLGYPILIIGARQDRLIHYGATLRLFKSLASEQTYMRMFEKSGTVHMTYHLRLF